MKLHGVALQSIGLALLLGVLASPAAFGFNCNTRLGDCVWYDNNQNGVQDPDEPGVPGVTVSLYHRSAWGWEQVASRTTDASGRYLFESLDAGEYYLEFSNIPAGHRWTHKNAGNPSLDSDVDADGITDVIMLGYCQADLTWDAGILDPPQFSNPGCGTPGYWKNHPEAWPVDAITIGSTTYTKAQALAIMKGASNKDMSTVMFAHLVSAKLNVLIGNSDQVIGPYIVAGDAWMSKYASPMPGKIRANSAAWAEGEPIKNMLDAYNNGLLDAPHRD